MPYAATQAARRAPKVPVRIGSQLRFNPLGIKARWTGARQGGWSSSRRQIDPLQVARPVGRRDQAPPPKPMQEPGAQTRRATAGVDRHPSKMAVIRAAALGFPLPPLGGGPPLAG